MLKYLKVNTSKYLKVNCDKLIIAYFKVTTEKTNKTYPYKANYN